MELDLGDTWDDPGATATDEEDGKITSKIVVVGEVDTDKLVLMKSFTSNW